MNSKLKHKATIQLAGLLMLLAAVLQACSTTAHLPEGEVLYTGIGNIYFGQKELKQSQKDGEKHRKQQEEKQRRRQQDGGVITAIDEAYTNVERLLRGEGPKTDADALNIDELTDFQRDSLKAEQAVQEAAEATVREEVEAVLSIAPNNSLLGSARVRFPLPIGLWFYNGFVNSRTGLGKWIFNTFSSTPVTLSTVNPNLRTSIAKNVLRNYGYFHGQVTYDILPQKDPRKAKVSYGVLPGQVYRFDSIAYQLFPASADSLIRTHADATLLRSGAPFTAATLDAERKRLNTLFRNNGYYYSQPTSITYRADTLQRPGWVQLQVRPAPEFVQAAGRQFRLRNTTIHLLDPLRGSLQTDTLYSPGYDLLPTPVQGNGRAGQGSNRRFKRDKTQPGVSMVFAGSPRRRKPSVEFDVLRQYVFHRKGDLYRQRVADLVQEKMSGLGIFSQVTVNYTPTDTTRTCDSLDVNVYAILDKPYDAEFKASVTSKSNGLVGPGLSFGMTKRNAFHGAEALTFQLYGSYEWQTGANLKGRSSLLNSYEYGTSLSLDYPYIRWGRLDSKLTRNGVANTSFKLEANWMNRANYFGRVTLGTRVVLNYQNTRYTKHELTPFRLDYELQLRSTVAFDSLMRENSALAVSMRNQFVPSMQYVLNMTNRKQARNQRTFTLTVKEAGNVLSGIYACFGQGFNQKNKNLFGVPFAQFLKTTAVLTQKYPLGSTGVCLAGRLFLGAVHSYGNATVAPYSDLFTIGGANSLRAFGIRTIGPGSYHPANSRYSYVNQVGDLKFEANLEARFPIIGHLNGAVFLDCGNVWLLSNNEDHPGGSFNWKTLGRELALGTGLGLRYDLDFLVVRFDLGVGIHAPYDTGRSGYYNMTSFGKSLGYHLAIGYPF